MKKDYEEEVSSLEDEEALSDLGEAEMWEQEPGFAMQEKVEDEGDRAFREGVKYLMESHQQKASLAHGPSHQTQSQLPALHIDHEEAQKYDEQY